MNTEVTARIALRDEQRQSLINMVLPLALEAREANQHEKLLEAGSRGFGALAFALRANIINGDEFGRLSALLTSARYERAIEQTYNHPLYTGAARSRAEGFVAA